MDHDDGDWGTMTSVTSDNTNPGSLQFIQDVCGVNEERAQELLEAGGSTERAIDIFFSQKIPVPHDDHDDHKAPAKRIKLNSPPPTASRQPRQGAFFRPAERSDKTDLPQKVTTPFASKSANVARQKDVAATHDMPRSSSDSRLHYLALATCFAKMTSTPKRLAKLDALKLLLMQIITSVGGIGGTEPSRIPDATILTQTMDLMLGSGLQLQVSWSAVSKAVMAVTGASSTQLRQAYRISGDSGDAAATFMRQQRLLVAPKPLTISSVYSTLTAISKCQGKGSQTQRHALMVQLLQSCRSEEIRFLVRTLLGNMRLGASLKTILTGLAMAVEETCGTTGNTKQLQDTFDVCPRLDKICLALLVGGMPHMVETCVLEVGTCINPMLANAAHSLEEVEKLMSTGGPIIAEWKYDGVRCQAHWNGSEMKLFSRHMLENTDQFPDAVTFFLEAKHDSVTSFIIDAEIVAVETDEEGNMRLLPFQDLSSRRGIAKDGGEIKIRIFAFDLIYVNGESLVKRPLHERQTELRRRFAEIEGFGIASSLPLDAYDETKVQEYLHVAVRGGAEGLMIKLTGSTPRTDQTSTALTCHYESGVRSHAWLKVKRDYVAGFADTIDVVPIGAWHGSGRKAERNFLSPVLLAVYDDEEDVYKSISRCMTFTDAMYDATREFYFRGTPYPPGVGMDEGGKSGEEGNVSDNDELVSAKVAGDDEINLVDYEDRINCYPSKPSALLITNESPPIWFKPMEVWEVSFADLSLSKQHTAAQGLVDPNRGVALRFPRFKRRRPDKRIDQATTCNQIAELFVKQSKIQSGSSKGK
jgi:DNA ligase 1